MTFHRFRYCLALSCTLVTLAVTSPALAWGTKGHRIIGALAEERLTATTRAVVAEILEGQDLANASTWADEMRGAQDNPQFWSDYAAYWHYVNIPPGQSYEASEKNPRGDAYAALEVFTVILLGREAPAGPVREGLELYFGDLAARDAEVQRFALKFLLHIIGDLQQPLHSGRAEDRGGNELQVSWFGEASNLHAVWDTHLIEQANLGYTVMARRLSARIARTPGSQLRFWETAVPLAWIEDGQRTLERIYARHAVDTALDTDYTTDFVPTVELQLLKGGLRMAFLLNSIFDGQSVGAWRKMPTSGEFIAGL